MQVQELYRIEKMNYLSAEVIEAILKRGKIFEVGGAVRDKYLFGSAKTKDRDFLVTGIKMDDLKNILRKFGRVDLVGQVFGVIKFTETNNRSSETFDIALPRKEYSTGESHRDFKVTFDPGLSVEDDLLRRDFTINAIALEIATDELIDPLDGIKDIADKKIRIVYDKSFEDDPLRMIRAIQFAARFEFEIETKTFEALKKNAHLINTVSKERIQEELNKLLLLAKSPSIGFRLMQKSGLLKEILPELEICVGVDQPGGFHKHDVFEHTLHIIDATPQTLRLRLAALFHDINKPQAKRIKGEGATFYSHEVHGAKTAKAIMKRFRYSLELSKEVSILVARHMFASEVSDKGLRRLIRKVGLDLIFDLLDLRRADVIAQGMGGTTEDIDLMEQRIKDEIDKKSPFGYSDLALSGSELMQLLSLKEGPIIGKLLEHMMESVLDDPANNNAETLERLSKEYIENINENKDRGNANEHS